MTTIGIIGSSNIGAAVARLAVDAGVDVVIANARGPASLSRFVEELGAHATASRLGKRPGPANSCCSPSR